MNKYGKFVGLFREFYNEDNIKIDEKLSGYVNFKVGGPADILLIPDSIFSIASSIEVNNPDIFCCSFNFGNSNLILPKLFLFKIGVAVFPAINFSLSALY